MSEKNKRFLFYKTLRSLRKIIAPLREKLKTQPLNF